MTISMKQVFVQAMDRGNYVLAQDVLFKLYDYYADNGFDTVEERDEFEMVVKWFDSQLVEPGLVRKQKEVLV
jgi:hypothetical protein